MILDNFLNHTYSVWIQYLTFDLKCYNTTDWLRENYKNVYEIWSIFFQFCSNEKAGKSVCYSTQKKLKINHCIFQGGVKTSQAKQNADETVNHI